MSFRVLIFPLVLAKKGPQWPPKGNPHNLESYYGSLNRIWLASERWHQNSIIRIMMLSFFDRLWPSWEFPMCNLDMWGVFSGVKLNSKPLLFYGLWQINASIKLILWMKIWPKFVPYKSSRRGSWRPGTLKGKTFSTFSHMYIPIRRDLGQKKFWQALPRFRGALLILSVPQWHFDYLIVVIFTGQH